MWGAQALLEVRRRFLVGSGRTSMLMLVRSAAALATMRPVFFCRDDDVHYYICQRLKLEGETENMDVAERRLGFTENTARRHRRVG